VPAPGERWSLAGLMEIMSFTVRELRDHELDKVSGGLDAGKNEVAVEGVVSVADDVSMKSGPSNYNKKNVTMIRDAPIVLG
jgi:hypothetical protein